jgi:multicomponent Na+:H+ antiporter subunit C
MMMDILPGHYPLLFCILLIIIGLYGLMFKRNLVKMLIGLNILQSAIILFFIIYAHKWGATVPILDPLRVPSSVNYVNPLPHALMLTAIVVSVAVTGVALVLLRRIYARYRTLDERELIEKMRETR